MSAATTSPSAYGAPWGVHVRDLLVADPTLGMRLIEMLTAPSEWVHRRVEHVRFEGGDRMRYHFSVDFSVPEMAPSATLPGGQNMRIIPLATLPARGKGDGPGSGWMLNFDLRDEAGAALSMLSSREAEVLSSAAVTAFAMGALKAGKKPWKLRPLVEEWLKAHVALAYGGLAKAEGGPTVSDVVRPIKDIEGDTEPNESDTPKEARARAIQREQMLALQRHPFVMGLLNDLTASVVLYVALPDPPGTRRVLKFSYDRAFRPEFKAPTRPMAAPSEGDEEVLEVTSGPGRLRSRFALTPMLIVDEAPGAAQAWSYHHLMDPPPGVRVIRAELQRRSRTGKWIVLDRDVTGRQRMSHLNSSGWLLSRRYRVVVQIGMDPDVWLQQLAVATTVVALLMAMFVTAAWGSSDPGPLLLPVATLDETATLRQDLPEKSPVDLSVMPIGQDQQGTTAVLLTLAGAAYGFVARPGEHRLAARLVWGIRVTAWIMATLPVLTAAALVFFPSILNNRLLLGMLLLTSGIGAALLWVARDRALRPNKGGFGHG